MSIQATIARSEARQAEQAWREHKQCPKCSRRRERCKAGQRLWDELTEARARLAGQRLLDKAPAPGQGALF